MPRHTIDVQIERKMRTGLTSAWVRRVVSRVLARASLDSPVEVAVLLTDDTTIQRLNRDYRGIDHPTDVLSFTLDGQAEKFPHVPSALSMLGQVVVSYPRAVEQAADYGHSVEREVAFLVAHGVLHLLGYDHGEPAAEACMVAFQEEVLAALGISRE